MNLQTREWIINGAKLSSTSTTSGEDLLIILPGYSLSAQWAIEHYRGIINNSKVFALNLPGFYGTELTGEYLSIEALYYFIKTIIKDQQVNKINLAGHSFGGRLALILAYKYPELINKLILIAPVIKVNKVEGILNFIPDALLKKIFNSLFKGKNLLTLGKTLNTFGLVTKSDLNYLKQQNDNNTNKELFKYYAKSIPRLRVTKSIINKVFNNSPVNLYLSKNDPHADYNYWKGIADNYKTVELLNLNGGHFGKIV